jgi:uncharacterized protein YndB with AHSA1/START domain
MNPPFAASFRMLTPRESALTLSRSLRQPVEKVWAALVTPERLAAWMGVEWLGADTPLGEGAAFSYRFRNTDMESRGRVLRFEPPYVLEHSWFDNVPPGATIRWELAREGDGSRLTLTHHFPEPDDAPRTAAGWAQLLEALAAALGDETAVPVAGMEGWRRNRDVFAASFPREATRDGRQIIVDGAPALRFERFFPKPAGDVWTALTEPAAIGRWLQAEATIEPHVGGQFLLLLGGGSSRMDGRITAWQPPTLLEYTWPEAAANGDSTVRFELASDDAGTWLILTHRLPSGGDLPDFASGWHWHLDALDIALEGEAREFDRPRWAALRRAYAATL